MKTLIYFVLIFAVSCTGTNDKQKSESLNEQVVTKDSVNNVVTKDTSVLPAESRYILDNLENRLKNEFDGKLHVLTDKEAKWNKEDLDFIILPARKKDPMFPIIAKGDFNWDG